MKKLNLKKNWYYLVRCSCGSEYLVRKDYLKYGIITCCKQCSLKNKINKYYKTKRQLLKEIFNSNDTIQQDMYFYVTAYNFVNELKNLKPKSNSCLEIASFINKFLNT